MRRNIIGALDLTDIILGLIGMALTGTGSIAMFAQYNGATPVQFIITVALHALVISAFVVVAANIAKLARSKK